MKKEFWRKSRQCADCIHHRSQGLRQESTDPVAVRKEACRFSGYSFWQELEECEICFYFESAGSDTRKQYKTKIDRWANKHLCSQCAFFGINGYDLCDKTIIRNPGEWHALHRCQGYFRSKEADKNCFCSSFLSLPQWATVESTPLRDGERIRKWEEFKKQNSRGGEIAEKE